MPFCVLLLRQPELVAHDVVDQPLVGLRHAAVLLHAGQLPEPLVDAEALAPVIDAAVRPDAALPPVLLPFVQPDVARLLVAPLALVVVAARHGVVQLPRLPFVQPDVARLLVARLVVELRPVPLSAAQQVLAPVFVVVLLGDAPLLALLSVVTLPDAVPLLGLPLF